MAKFCSNCGKELVDGKCSKCGNVKESAKGSFNFKDSCLECWKAIAGIFTKPVDTISKFVVDNKFISGIMLIIVTALFTGVYKIASLKSIETSFSDINYLKEFFNEFLTNLGLYAALVIIGWAVITKLFKGKGSLKQMVQIVGISLVVSMLSYLICSALVFVDKEVIIYIMKYIFSFASIYEFITFFVAVKEVSGIDKNKLFLTVSSIFICSTIVVDVILKIFE